MAITLDGSTVPLPREFSATLLKNSFEQSVISPLTPSTPMRLGVDSVIPVYEGGIEAGFVGEGEAKPVSDAAMSFQTLKTRKVAAIVVVSKELAQVNPAQLMTYVQQDMSNAITRALDLGILYGIDAKSGAAIDGATSVNATTNRVQIADGDLVPQLLAGYDLAAGEKSDPSGFAFDTRWRSKIALATQQQVTIPGAPAPMPNLATAADSVAGLPATYGRVVSGRVGTNPDTGVKGFIGDWSKLKWGYAEKISVQRSTEATIVDGGTTYHLFQQNMIALLVEAHVGWTITDATAFAAYEGAAAGGDTGEVTP